MTTPRKPSLTALVVGLAIVFGGAVRIYKLADQNTTRDEMVALGTLPLNGISASAQPATLFRVINDNLFYGTHPPAYPIMMYGLTRAFASSLTAIRLLSAFFGVASIGLVYWLGIVVGQRATGCIAALLLAFNGFHAAQAAGQYTLVCFLSLLATILLILLSRETRRRRVIEFLYGAVMLLGLACQHFFWALLAAHMVWVLANAWVQQRRLPRLLSIQIFVMILGSPLLAISRLQSLNGAAGFGARFAVIAGEYLQFFWILPGSQDLGVADPFSPAVSVILRAALCLFCLVILVIGLRRLIAVDDPTLSAPGKPFILLWILAASLATFADVALVLATRQQVSQSPGPWIHLLGGVELLAILPSILFMGAITAVQAWQPLRAFGLELYPQLLAGDKRLILLLTFFPFALLAIASVFQRPFLNASSLLFVAPYLLFALARGIVSLARRSRPLAITLFLLLATLHAYSLFAYSR